jgi:hypothetical protein
MLIFMITVFTIGTLLFIAWGYTIGLYKVWYGYAFTLFGIFGMVVQVLLEAYKQ